MDTELAFANEAMKAVPHEFWYGATIVLAAILVWVIKDFVTWLRKAVNELNQSVQQLTNMVRMHEQQLSDHEEEIEALKGKPIKRRGPRHE